ncbi:Uncharacterized protein dnl_56150 [Desulfonema limicola]|uniref:DUF3570 domain-containing protein n=1 Tax=Desulfonema limicola TaxID=45656 RepID=A0A975GJ73_9BACT|nr:hypothetical protein [Desulfonema limicola]QTA83219.1 Uncharacterized protein dnl_56150 [Desulfonema limicola]
MKKQNKKTISEKNLWILIIIMLLTYVPSYAENLGGSLLRDFPLALPLSQDRLEFSFDYLDLGDLTDVYGAQDGYLDNMQGFRALLNYGLFTDTTLQSSFILRNLDYGTTTMQIFSSDISFKQMLTKKRSAKSIFAALDIGIKTNYADDMVYTDQADINRSIARFAPGISINNNDEEYVWFEKNNEIISEKISRQNRSELQAGTQELYDFTPYLRLTAGKLMGSFFPNIHLEYGNPYIRSKSDSTLNEYIPESLSDQISNLPQDLDRSENYLKAGVCLLWKFPYKAMAHIEYNYIRLFRDNELGYLANDNHVIKADMSYFLTRRFILNMGGTYYHKQFNGVIPFINNEFTWSTFDDRYGRMHIGFTYLFQG